MGRYRRLWLEKETSGACICTTEKIPLGHLCPRTLLPQQVSVLRLLLPGRLPGEGTFERTTWRRCACTSRRPGLWPQVTRWTRCTSVAVRPPFLGADGLVQILNAVRRRFSVSGNGEITFEANPDSVTEKLLKRLRAEGFNRISLGSRTMTTAFSRSWAAPQLPAGGPGGGAGPEGGLPQPVPGSDVRPARPESHGLGGDLEHVLELAPEHMSCYGLKVEEGTPLWQYKDAVNLPDDDAQADMYLSAVPNPQGNTGYAQYEISNFARRGFAVPAQSEILDRGRIPGLRPRRQLRLWGASGLPLPRIFISIWTG